MFCRYIAATLVATLALPLIASAEVLEIPLRFENSGDHEDATPYGSSYTELESVKPEGLGEVPEFIGGKPLFGTVELGENEYHFALDASGDDSSRYDTVYFDQDLDGDLTDDPVLKGELIEFDDGGFWFAEFEGELTLEYSLGGVRLPYVMGLSLQGQDISKIIEQLPEGFDVDSLMLGIGINASFDTRCFYSGSFSLNGEEYRLRLGDSDCDGQFGEVAYIDDRYRYAGDELYPQGDSLHLTVEDEFAWTDSVLFGDHLIVGGRVFEVEVAIPEKKLTLTPIESGLLPLELANEPERLVLHSKGFEHTVMMIEPGDEVLVPAGEYRIVNYTMLGMGEEGDLWRLGATGTKKSPFVTVVAEGEAKLELGEPFTAWAGVPAWFSDQLEEEDVDEVRLEFNIRGSGNESVSALNRIDGETSACAMSAENPSQPLEPTYTIVAKTGEQVAKASFEYG